MRIHFSVCRAVATSLVLLAVLTPAIAGAAPTTTTLAPTTTTTLAPTTTTLAPTTTTTLAPTTTTTVAPTTTMTSSSSSSSASTWAWILGGIAALALIAAAVAALIAVNRRKQATDTWIPSARAGLETASLARTLLLAQPTGGDDQIAQVRAQAEDAARALDRSSANAPDEQSRQATSSVAEGLRGVVFSLEAEHLLRSGATSPTAAQLAEADVARRRRAGELDAALAQLDMLTRPPAR